MFELRKERKASLVNEVRGNLFVHYNNRDDTVFYLENLPTKSGMIESLKDSKSPISSSLPLHSPEIGQLWSLDQTSLCHLVMHKLN